MSPELCESVLLFAAVAWLLYLAMRQQPKPRALLYAALYLVIPAAVLAGQALGLQWLALTGRWFAVAANGALLVLMVSETHDSASPMVKALVEAEKEMQRRELKAQAHVLAKVLQGNKYAG